MEKPEDFTQKRESTVTTYSELGKSTEGEKLSIDHWGVTKYKGELILFYTDPELIRETFTNRIIKNLESQGIAPEQPIKIADFGGGDGVLLDTVTKQLAEAGYTQILGVNVDFTARHLDTMRSKFITNDESSNNIRLEGVQGDLTNLPLETGSIDAGYSRFALQYINKQNQPRAISEMLRTLKPGAELIIQWPRVTETEEQATFADEFDANIDSIMTGIPLEQVRGKRHLASLAEVQKIAEGLGVTHKVSFIDGLIILMSADLYANRFNITDSEKLTKLQALFTDPDFRARDSTLGISSYVEKDGKEYIEQKIGLAVLKP